MFKRKDFSGLYFIGKKNSEHREKYQGGFEVKRASLERGKSDGEGVGGEREGVKERGSEVRSVHGLAVLSAYYDAPLFVFLEFQLISRHKFLSPQRLHFIFNCFLSLFGWL